MSNHTFIPRNCYFCQEPLPIPRPNNQLLHSSCAKVVANERLQDARRLRKGQPTRNKVPPTIRRKRGICSVCGNDCEPSLSKCKDHIHIVYKYPNKKKPIEEILFYNAKTRAKKFGLTFTINLVDIVVPEKCPVLGITLTRGTGKACDNSPSLDRTDPQKGYTRENVRVISFRANTLKSNATVEELEKVLNYIKHL